MTGWRPPSNRASPRASRFCPACELPAGASRPFLPCIPQPAVPLGKPMTPYRRTASNMRGRLCSSRGSASERQDATLCAEWNHSAQDRRRNPRLPGASLCRSGHDARLRYRGQPTYHDRLLLHDPMGIHTDRLRMLRHAQRDSQKTKWRSCRETRRMRNDERSRSGKKRRASSGKRRRPALGKLWKPKMRGVASGSLGDTRNGCLKHAPSSDACARLALPHRTREYSSV